MVHRITVERVKDFIISKAGNEYDLTTLNNVSNALSSLHKKRMDELTENGIDTDYFIDDEECQVILAYSDFINDEIAKESEPKINEGGRRKKRTRRHKKSRKSRKARKSRKSRKARKY
jgi:hypothetical protein